MADDEVQVFIPLSQGFGVDGGDTLLVQHMGLGTAVQPRDAGETGVVAQLVHVGGIHGVHGLVVFAA